MKLESKLEGDSFDTVCKKCGENRSECICNQAQKLLEPQKHLLTFHIEKRNGKLLTIVGEFFVDNLKELSANLKKRLSTGGSIEENRLIFQGDMREKIKPLLLGLGFRFKK